MSVKLYGFGEWEFITHTCLPVCLSVPPLSNVCLSRG